MNSLLMRYTIAIVAVALALFIRLVLDPFLEPGQHVYTAFFAAVVFVSWYSGMGPALLALVLGAGCAVYFILDPYMRFDIANPGYQVGLALYLVLGSMVLFGYSIYKTRQRAQMRMEWLGMVVEATAHIIWTTNPEGQIVEDSPSWRAFTGQSYEQWKGWGWLDTLHPDDRERAAKAWSEAVANKTVYQIEYRVRTKAGDYRWMAARGVPLLEPDGRVWQWVGMNTDIHDRKRAEQALRESEEQFRVAFHQTAVGMSQANLNGQFVLVNERFCEITGYTREELLTKTFLEITHSEDIPLNREKFAQLLAGKTPSYDIEKRYVRKNGQPVWVQVTASFAHDASGNPQYVVAAVQDISERKQKDQALRFLVELNMVTQQLTEPEDIVAGTARLLGEHLGVNRCAYATVEADDDHFTIMGDFTRNVPSLNGRFSLSSFGAEALRLLRADKTYVVDDVNTDPRIGPDHLPAYRQTQIQAVICVPLQKAGRFVACMAVHQSTPRHWLTDEIELVELVIGRCWESIERARTVRNLRESERRQRFIMDTMPQKIFTAKPNGDVDYFNPQWTEFTGLSLEQIKGWGWTQFVHPDDLERSVRLWRNAVDTGEPFQLEHRFRRADGEYRWHMSRALPMRDAEDRIVMWIGSNTDIHDLKQASDATGRRSEQVRRLANIATHLNTAHDISSLMGVVTEEARNLIGAHQCVTSFTINENWGQAINTVSLSDKYANWRDYDIQPDGSGIYSLVCRMNKPMRMTQAELEAHSAWKGFGAEAGRHPPMRGWLVAPLVEREGSNIGLIQLSDKYEGEFSEDDEAILVQMAQMVSVAIENARLVGDLREASRRKDEFLATLAHELRNPLAPIRNMLEVMKQSDGNAALHQQARAMMDRQMAHMVRLIDDLLDVSRVSRGKLELRLEKVELTEIVYQAVGASREQVRCAKQALDVALPTEPVYLYADPVRLTQIFDNLLNNACKYTQPEGNITLSAERQGDNAVVKVKDTGIGIPPDKLGSIFEMFAQIDHSLERVQGGLGIGLTLVKQLVEMHGGTVTAHSNGPGQGAEFVVRLPVLKEKSKAAAPAPAGMEPPMQPRRILVVDDNRDNVESLVMLLEMAGNQTYIAYDGLEAVEAAEHFRPDLILLDIGLPKLNGYEACRRIREQPWGKDAMIVAVSGWGQEQDRRKSQDAGFDHHLIKPIDAANLMKLLAEQSLATAH